MIAVLHKCVRIITPKLFFFVLAPPCNNMMYVSIDVYVLSHYVSFKQSLDHLIHNINQDYYKAINWFDSFDISYTVKISVLDLVEQS